MKKFVVSIIIVIVILAIFLGLKIMNDNSENEIKNEVVTTSKQTENVIKDNTSSSLTKEMAYEGVNNYCHSNYDWSVSEDNPDIMYVVMGDETETEYQVKFCSYTGAFVYFYVNKSNGITRLVEYNPTLNKEEAAGTINIYDYINKSNENITSNNVKYEFTSADNDATKGNPKILKIYELNENQLSFEYNCGFDFSKSTIDRNISGVAKVNDKNQYVFEENISEHKYKLVFEFNENKDSVKIYEYDNDSELGQISLWR